MMEPPDVRAWLIEAHEDNQRGLAALATRFPGKMSIINGRLRVAR
jgi:hypothetical protein